METSFKKNIFRQIKCLGFLILMFFLRAESFAQALSSAPPPKASFQVDGHIALSSLMALSDGHLLKLLDSLTFLSTTDMARSAEWALVQKQLQLVAVKNVPALLWFALPNGSYWTLREGKAKERLSDREYWPRLMAGKKVLGDLVVSKSTGKNVAVVAVPVRSANRAIIGVLGASVYLDKMTEILKKEMNLAGPLIFYAVDSKPLGALNSESNLIFTEPRTLSPELRRAFGEMLSREEGLVRYRFRGRLRTVLYRKSPVSGWWYGFGKLDALPNSG